MVTGVLASLAELELDLGRERRSSRRVRGVIEDWSLLVRPKTTSPDAADELRQALGASAPKGDVT